MKIVILGARPNPAKVTADIVFYINTTISKRKEYPGDHYAVHIVASSQVLGPFKRGLQPELDRAKIDSYRGQVSDELCVVGPEDASPVYKRLNELGYTYNLASKYSSAEQKEIIREVTGLSYPINVSGIFDFGVSHGVALLRTLTKFYVRNLVHRFRVFNSPTMKAYPRAFKPSNGVFALVEAIRRFGVDNEYFLTGISLYPFSYEYDFGNGLPPEGLRDHVLADRKVLSSLRTLHIFTDDDYTSRYTGINLIP